MTTGLSASGRSSMDWRISLSVLLLAVLQASLAFNIDPAAWKSLSDPADGFGYKVVQRTKDNLLISAPLQDYGGQKRGGIYQCTVGTSSCTLLAVPVPNEAVNMSLGLTMTKHPVKSDTLVCGPTIPRDCKSITTYNGMCLEINSRNHVGLPVPASLDRCPVNADICFLLDGSGSVSPDDFERMKSFVNSLIEDLVGRGSQFAVVQYSYRTEIHFDFKAFSDNGWKEKVEAISRLRGGTKTAAGIKEVVNNVFSTNGGSRPDVKKILIVITDGQSQDGIYLPSAASDADKKSIVRFAIGVGDAFSDQRAKAELYQIASDNRVLQVNNFEELGGKIRDELQESIFSIEGSQVGGETLEMEMAQQGFSAAYLPQGGFQMGTVGAFQWNGGYHKYSGSSEKPTFYKPSNTEADGYLGYSMAVAETCTHTFTIVGAPRFQHTGRVFVFSSDIPDQIIDDPSHQIGIYFGAEVCAIDVGGNSDTDLVLLSAPMYAERDREGRVYVCLLRRRGVQCSPGDTGMMMTLLGKTGERGRFGTSLAPLPDLNADGLNDLAVGAPLENDGQGSIYIFNGERGKISNVYSIKEGYSQRIPGSAVQDGLRFFGLSISQSSLDLSGDGLPDLAVGSNGAVLLLRSKPIVRVEPEVSFSPNKIPTNHTDCKIPLRNNATICFTMISNTSAQAEINYTLTLDSTRPVHFIAYIQPEQQEVTNSITLRGRQCVSHLFFIEACPDGFIPLSNRLSFTFKGLPSENDLSPSLAQNPKTPSYYPLGFEICGRDNKCIDNLKVDFNFTDTSELRVGIQDVLNVTVTVDSREDNSYNSRVIVTYPAEMSYKTVIMVKGRVECSPLDSEDRVTPGTADCTIDKPLFKGKERAVFIISFHVDINSQFGQMVTFTANATSGSNHSAGSELFQRREIGVKYSIYVLISRVEDSTSYTNFSAGKNDLQKPVRQSMKVVNFDRDVNLTVIVKVPMWLGDKDIWVNPSGMQIPGCRRGSDEEPTVKDFVEKLKRKQPLDCSVARCGVFLCNHVVSKEDNNFYIHISGNLSSGWIEQIGLTSALFDLVSTATLNYDITKYIYFSTNSQNNPPVLKIGTTVEVYAEVDLTKEIIGSTLGGLALLALITAGLYKAGFFKSNVKQMMNNASNSAPQPDNEGVEAPQELT